MIKVILTTMAGRKSDLFPESFTIREVFDALQEDCTSKVLLSDGTVIPEEDLGRCLREYAKDDDMRISTVTYPPVETEPYPFSLDLPSEEESISSVYDALIQMRNKLNETTKKLEDQHPDLAVPF